MSIEFIYNYLWFTTKIRNKGKPLYDFGCEASSLESNKIENYATKFTKYLTG